MTPGAPIEAAPCSGGKQLPPPTEKRAHESLIFLREGANFRSLNRIANGLVGLYPAAPEVIFALRFWPFGAFRAGSQSG